MPLFIMQRIVECKTVAVGYNCLRLSRRCLCKMKMWSWKSLHLVTLHIWQSSCTGCKSQILFPHQFPSFRTQKRHIGKCCWRKVHRRSRGKYIHICTFTSKVQEATMLDTWKGNFAGISVRIMLKLFLRNEAKDICNRLSFKHWKWFLKTKNQNFYLDFFFFKIWYLFNCWSYSVFLWLYLFFPISKRCKCFWYLILTKW